MNTLLLTADELASGADGVVRLADARRVAHVRDVHRAAVGDALRVGVVGGKLGTATVLRLADDALELHVRLERDPPPPVPLALVLALPRPKVMRRLWAQLAAIGLDRIILTNAEKVERNYFDTHVLTPESYVPLLIEGLQQARDTRLPRVTVHRQFRVLLEDELDGISDAPLRLVAHPDAPAAPDQYVRGRRADRLLLAIGPEGGWNPFELELLEARGFMPVGMGVRTLRTDTACISLLALVHGALRAV